MERMTAVQTRSRKTLRNKQAEKLSDKDHVEANLSKHPKNKRHSLRKI